MKKITAYECEFCGKLLKTRAHGYYCYFDPKNKACVTCENLEFGAGEEPNQFGDYYCLKNHAAPFKEAFINCPEYK